MRFQILERQCSVLVFEDAGANYVASCQVFLYGDVGLMYNINGHKFYELMAGHNMVWIVVRPKPASEKLLSHEASDETWDIVKRRIDAKPA